MARHSKNSTALGFFTYAEKQKTNYGTKKQRLGKDSMRRFDHCYLCLQKAKTPVSCLKGHISCRTCTVEHIATQKIARARQLKQADLQRKADESKLKQEEEVEKAKQLIEFEKLQAQVTSVSAIRETNETKEKNSNKRASDGEKVPETKFLGDGYGNTKLPSFWLPSLTPNTEIKTITASETQIKATPVQCTAAEPHPISLKKLLTIRFSTGEADKDQDSILEADPICPSCVKVLTNAKNPVFIGECGHVFCKPCADKFIVPTLSCFTCSTSCPHSYIQFQHDGTGFSAGGGKVVAERFGLAFQ